MGKLATLNSLSSLSGKSVLLRIDSDVDIENGKILDDTRLLASEKTIKFLLEKDSEINIIGHLGRPEGHDDRYTLYPIAKWLSEKFGGTISEITIGNLKAWKIGDALSLIENIRFFDEEEENDKEFSRELALLGDIYVNDAFAVSHRAHASIVGVTEFLPSYAGLHLEEEIKVLGEVLKDPKRPLAVLIGGAKIETKLPMVEKMHHIADYVLVGGEIAEQTRVLIKVQHEKLEGNKSAVLVAENNDKESDITAKSVENFKQVLGLAKTIVWNGPVGITTKDKRVKTENGDSSYGTSELAKYIASCSAYKIVGGGDTLSFLREAGFLNKFDFVSTGGGAMLEFLSGKDLPGIKSLER